MDADNCYDRIAHPIASMVFQLLGVPKEAAVSMLSTIQDMKIFLQTGFGDSKAYAGSANGKKTQGLCQGNGAAPAGWGVTSITMIRAHKQKDMASIFPARSQKRTTIQLALFLWTTLTWSTST